MLLQLYSKNLQFPQNELIILMEYDIKLMYAINKWFFFKQNFLFNNSV